MNLTSEQIKQLAPLVKKRERLTAELLKAQTEIDAIIGLIKMQTGVATDTGDPMYAKA